MQEARSIHDSMNIPKNEFIYQTKRQRTRIRHKTQSHWVLLVLVSLTHMDSWPLTNIPAAATVLPETSTTCHARQKRSCHLYERLPEAGE